MEAGRKVLAVVYDPITAKTLRRSLIGQEGIKEIEIATTFEEARDRLSQTLPDIVIADWSRVNGGEVAKIAKERGVPNVIIIDGGERAGEIAAVGADRVTKPWDMADLMSAVRKKAATTGVIGELDDPEKPETD